jgi:hypothetical protein
LRRVSNNTSRRETISLIPNGLLMMEIIFTRKQSALLLLQPKGRQ